MPLFYAKHVRIGREAHTGYFILWFKRPVWISRKIDFYLD